jgi:hypothetical protein
LIVCLFNFDWAAGGFLVALGFFVWVMLPFGVAAAALRKHRHTAGRVCVLLIAIACAAAAFAYVDSFFLNLDPQSALVLVVVPLPQLLVVALLYAVANRIRGASQERGTVRLIP